MTDLTIIGYIYSVYTRTVRMVCDIKSIPYHFEDVDPFDDEQAEDVRSLHPFTRVPILHAEGFELYETQAILDFLEASFPDPALCPVQPERRARIRQVMSIADSYFYWPMVRQAAVQSVFNPLSGSPVDENELEDGLDAAPRVLDALEALAGDGLVLAPGEVTLADCHLWPMMDYALMVPEIADMVGRRPSLAAWAEAMRSHPAALRTEPDLEALSGDG